MDKGARAVGMVVFALGIGILIAVFGLAYGMFTSSPSEFLPTPAGGVTATGLGGSVAVMFIKIGLLFVMTLAGSSIAARGIHLYIGGKDQRGPSDDRGPG